MTYLLTWKGAFNDVKIARYEDRVSATEALNAIEEPSIGGCEVDTELDLNYRGAELVVIFNQLNQEETPIKEFRTKSDGQRRVFARIEDLAKNQPIFVKSSNVVKSDEPIEAPTASEEQETEMAAKKTKRVAKAKTPRVAKVKVAKTNGAGLDEFGFRKGSGASMAAALFSRKSGATMAEAKTLTGGNHFYLLKKLGKRVTHDGKKYFIS